MTKTFILNRLGQKMAVSVNESSKPLGLALFMHGLGDCKESPIISSLAQLFSSLNYTVVTFDTTNTFGESEGDFSKANISNYYNDLCDVISWMKTQDFYSQPFIIGGHSLGGISTATYAENNPEDIKALITLSTVVNIQCTKEALGAEEVANWEKTGWQVEDWDGVEIRLPYSYLLEKAKFDILPQAKVLTMPVLVIAGDKDELSFVHHQKLFFDNIPSDHKEFAVLEGAGHEFIGKNYLQQMKEAITIWLKKVL